MVEIYDDSTDWLDSEEGLDEDGQIDEYDLTSTPNDFNVLTIQSFIESGSVKIPGFQRNYVWDLKRASKLIESIVIGLPVPQVFLYEEGRNSFLVIDGQQRLMTIYYFVRQRFPRKEKRAQIRKVFNEHGRVPDEVLYDEELFENFNLRLPEVSPGKPNKFSGLNYARLGDYQTQFNLRTIRNVIIKQVSPDNDNSSIYEIFNRLNTGGINLTPQEIRASLYHSKFYDMLFRVNMNPVWRNIVGPGEPDLHVRDLEVLLRAVAMWEQGGNYTPSMVRFLNNYSNRAKSYSPSEVEQVEETLTWFFDLARNIPRSAFTSRANNKFSTPLFESVFAAVCNRKSPRKDVSLEASTVEAIKNDPDFLRYTTQRTTDTSNVKGRLSVAMKYVDRYV
ncbi:protein of unknown function DUF262 [Parafrankia sp. EAN1pec]|uniref:DUF262 domain-containing protein n=1 Tax=Parafrankia sp. (strain EAN1pec) TaxID=298653 RepID=UPI0000544E8E|nr:protein of unknown function DUF262 [Frankia sp. EAN1pec]